MFLFPAPRTGADCCRLTVPWFGFRQGWVPWRERLETAQAVGRGSMCEQPPGADLFPLPSWELCTGLVPLVFSPLSACEQSQARSGSPLPVGVCSQGSGAPRALVGSWCPKAGPSACPWMLRVPWPLPSVGHLGWALVLYGSVFPVLGRPEGDRGIPRQSREFQKKKETEALDCVLGFSFTVVDFVLWVLLFYDDHFV